MIEINWNKSVSLCITLCALFLMALPSSLMATPTSPISTDWKCGKWEKDPKGKCEEVQVCTRTVCTGLKTADCQNETKTKCANPIPPKTGSVISDVTSNTTIQTTDLVAEKPTSNQGSDLLSGKLEQTAVVPLVVKKAGAAGQTDVMPPVGTSTDGTNVAARSAIDGAGANSYESCNSEDMRCTCKSFSTCEKMEKECKNPNDIKCETGTFNCSCEWKGKVGAAGNFNIMQAPASKAISE